MKRFLLVGCLAQQVGGKYVPPQPVAATTISSCWCSCLAGRGPDVPPQPVATTTVQHFLLKPRCQKYGMKNFFLSLKPPTPFLFFLNTDIFGLLGV